MDEKSFQTTGACSNNLLAYRFFNLLKAWIACRQRRHDELICHQGKPHESLTSGDKGAQMQFGGVASSNSSVVAAFAYAVSRLFVTVYKLRYRSNRDKQ